MAHNVERIFKITGLRCANCALIAQKAINQLPETRAAVNFATEEAVVNSPESLSVADIIKAIESAGYQASEVQDSVELVEKPVELIQQVRILVAGLCALPMVIAMPLMWVYGEQAHIPVVLQWLLATPVQFFVAWPFYRGAWHALRLKASNMDVLVSLGTLSAYMYSVVLMLTHQHGDVYFEASVVVIALIMLGKHLESRAKKASASAIERLLHLTPKSTWREISPGQFSLVSLSEVHPGDLIRVMSGEAVPVDGTIIDGKSSVMEAMLTGEPVPIEKHIGDKVFAGTVNGDGVLICKVSGVGRNTVLAGIARLVSQAQGSRAPVQALVDRVSAWFVPSVLVVAGLTLLITGFLNGNWSNAIVHAVSVLVISCPCALGLATPTAIMVGIGEGARQGILVRNADALQRAAVVRTVVFDKTGTLTEGKLHLTDLFLPVNSQISKSEALSYALALEQGSAHPVAHAIRLAQSTDTQQKLMTDFKNESGRGVFGKIDGLEYGLVRWDASLINDPTSFWQQSVTRLAKEAKTLSVLLCQDTPVALMAFADTPRSDAIEALVKLKKMGIRTVMLTGDHEQSARSVADILGVDSFIAGVTPAGKLNEIERLLKEQPEGVMMVGDGINDAPALALASVGIAMGGGMDIALESAGIVLMNNRLLAIVDAIKLSRRTILKIRQNLFFAFIYNVLAIPLAALGLLSPTVAGAAMASSSISVVGNSLLLRCKR